MAQVYYLQAIVRLMFTYAAVVEQDEHLRCGLASDQARSHPLFPVLDYMAKKLTSQNETLIKLDGRLSRMETEITATLPARYKEVQDLIKDERKKMFKIKGSEYEVSPLISPRLLLSGMPST